MGCVDYGDLFLPFSFIINNYMLGFIGIPANPGDLYLNVIKLMNPLKFQAWVYYK